MTKSVKSLVVTFFIGCIVFVIGSLVYNGLEFKSTNEFLIYFGFYQLYTFVLTIINSLYFNYIRNRNNKEISE